LYKDLIEGYTNLAERFPLVEVNLLLTEAINKVVTELKDQPSTLQEISLQWFALLESKSLFDAAAHLAQTMRKQNTVLDAKSVGLYKKYEALAIGNTAPNIQLTKKKTLRNINNTILLVFGSSECGHCMDAKKELEAHYPKWQAKGNIEVVYISLDTDKEAFKTAYQNTPWQTYCDYKGWESQAAKDYFVNATPTYILLDKDLKILMHPKSLAQVAAWVHDTL
jgi:thioredoxin-related protein